LLAQTRLVLADLGRGRLAEVLDLEHLPDLDLAIVEGDALDPLDRLLLRLDLDQPEPGDQLLRLGEGPVDDGPGVPVEPHARAPRAGVEPLAREQDAGLDQFLVVAAHRLELFGGRHDAGLGLLVRLDQDHEAHGWSLPEVLSCGGARPASPVGRGTVAAHRCDGRRVAGSTRRRRFGRPPSSARRSDERDVAGSTGSRTTAGRSAGRTPRRAAWGRMTRGDTRAGRRPPRRAAPEPTAAAAR